MNSLEGNVEHDPPLAIGEAVHRALPALPAGDVDELTRIVECLVSTFHPDRVYVFGSHARGEAGPESDIDLLIVVPRATEPPHRLAQAAYHALPVHALPIEILVMSKAEFDRRSRAASSLPATVLREGRALYAA